MDDVRPTRSNSTYRSGAVEASMVGESLGEPLPLRRRRWFRAAKSPGQVRHSQGTAPAASQGAHEPGDPGGSLAV